MRQLTLSALITTILFIGTLPMADAASKKEAREKLASIIVPKAEFDEATLKSVFSYCKQQAKELDLDGEGFNFFFKCEPEKLEQTISLDVNDIPMSELLRYLCMGSELNYKVERHAIVIYDETGQKENMETRTYNIKPGSSFKTSSKKGKLGFKN